MTTKSRAGSVRPDDGFTLRSVPDYDALSRLTADIVEETLKEHARPAVTLPTGETPRGLYKELVQRITDGRLDFSAVQFFCLDEYLGTSIEDEASLTRWLDVVFLKPAHVPAANTHFMPSSAQEPERAAIQYEQEIQQAGGLDLAVVGIGLNGHVGFNEPGSPPESRTRVVDLTKTSRDRNAAYYDSDKTIPKQAITIGLATILEARKIVLIVSGESKATILQQALEGPITDEVPASHLRDAGSRLVVIADADAASRLSRI